MDAKPDGRKYSRILRRIVAIVGIMPANQPMSIREFAELISKKGLPEFYLERFKKSVSVERICDYVRYMRDISVLNPKDDKLVLSFTPRKRDEDWAQAMSDHALAHIGKILRKTPDKVPELLMSKRRKLFRGGHVPTIDAVITELEIEGGRPQELFRWSLYVYTDGPTCPFDIRRHPVLSSTAEEED